MIEGTERYSLELSTVERGEIHQGVEELVLKTDAGNITARYHNASGGDVAVLWVGGAGGGLDGPAGGLYPRVASRLAGEGIASLRMHYRYPGDLIDCVLDTLIGVEYLKLRKRRRVCLVGYSFGGSVVINAGIASDAVVAVAALSSQTLGADDVAGLSPRPLLLLHGENDEVLPDACAHYLYQRALEPKTLLLYPGCGHALDGCREQVDNDLLGWMREILVE
jgi:fermentation-respiration switch protein FrsA (DUF1100 family)